MLNVEVSMIVVGSFAPVRQARCSGTRLSTERPRALGRL
jgi:hypothetical protein